MTARVAGKVPFGWDGREILAVVLVVRKLLQRTRGKRYTCPTSVDEITWHTSKRSPHLGGTSRSHLWLDRGASIYGHALAFGEGLVRPGTLKQEERDAIASHFSPMGTAPKMFDKPKAPKPKKKAKPDKLMKASADVRRWTVEVVKRQRALKMAQKKLASAQRSERAIVRARELLPVERASDETLRAKVRALRTSNPATALGHE